MNRGGPRAVAAGALLIASFFLPAAAEAYVRTRPSASGPPLEWRQTELFYWVHADGMSTIPMAELLPVVQQSFEAWSEVPCADITLTFAGLTADEEIGFDRSEGAINTNLVRFWESSTDWEHPGGIIALTTSNFDSDTGAMLDSDIEVNGFEYWLTIGDEGVRTDVANTLTHEVGHFLGFDHSPVSRATMFSAAPEGETRKRTLGQDDVDGLCAVYPNGEPVPVIEDDDELPDPQDRAGVDRGFCGAAPGGLGAGSWVLLLAFALVRRRR